MITFRNALIAVAVVLLVLAGFDVNLSDDVHEGFLGLAFFAASRLY